MKILFSLTYYYPYVSGLSIHTKRLAEAFVIRKHIVSVLTMQHENTLSIQESYAGVHIRRARPLFRVSKGFFSIDWLFRCVQEVGNTDVIIINLPQVEGLIPALIGKLFAKKIIAIYHCEVSLPNSFFNRFIQGFLELINSLTLYLSDRVVTYTEDYAIASRILKPYLRKTVYILPPVPVPQMRKSTAQAFKKIIGESDYVIGVAARLSEEKGIEYLIQAWPQIKEKLKNKMVKLVVAGPMKPVGEAVYSEKIIELVKKYSSDVIFLGSVSQNDMGAYYSLLDVLVLPSVNSTEAFGMVQVEAMFCGVPIVASDLPGVRVPIRETGMGIVVPAGDSRAIALAITEILGNPKKYIQSRQRITDIFSMDKSVQDFETLLKGY